MNPQLLKLTHNEIKTIQDLFRILQNIWQQKTETFSGLGIIFYKKLDTLPIFSLRNSYNGFMLPTYGWSNIEQTLKNISEKSSIYHDGFHLIASDISLTHVSQYFSPPIIKHLIDQNNSYLYGCRYRAAQFGSCLNGVIATAVVTDAYKCVLFVDGLEIDVSTESGVTIT